MTAPLPDRQRYHIACDLIVEAEDEAAARRTALIETQIHQAEQPQALNGHRLWLVLADQDAEVRKEKAVTALTYIGPANPGPPPSGWMWYERASHVAFFQITGDDILIPFPESLVAFGITQEDIDAARVHAKVKAAKEKAP